MLQGQEKEGEREKRRKGMIPEIIRFGHMYEESYDCHLGADHGVESYLRNFFCASFFCVRIL